MKIKERVFFFSSKTWYFWFGSKFFFHFKF